jgi:hypothetical protein
MWCFSICRWLGGAVFSYEGSSPEWEKTGDANLGVKRVCRLDSMEGVEGLRKSAGKSIPRSGTRKCIGASWVNPGTLGAWMIDDL